MDTLKYPQESQNTDADVETILAEVPKGDKNRNPTSFQIQFKCVPFGLSGCHNIFCVYNKIQRLFALVPHGEINLTSTNWLNYFNMLLEEEEKFQLAFKTTDNYLSTVYNNHM